MLCLSHSHSLCCEVSVVTNLSWSGVLWENVQMKTCGLFDDLGATASTGRAPQGRCHNTNGPSILRRHCHRHLQPLWHTGTKKCICVHQLEANTKTNKEQEDDVKRWCWEIMMEGKTTKKPLNWNTSLTLAFLSSSPWVRILGVARCRENYNDCKLRGTLWELNKMTLQQPGLAVQP